MPMKGFGFHFDASLLFLLKNRDTCHFLFGKKVFCVKHFAVLTRIVLVLVPTHGAKHSPLARWTFGGPVVTLQTNPKIAAQFCLFHGMSSGLVPGNSKKQAQISRRDTM